MEKSHLVLLNDYNHFSKGTLFKISDEKNVVSLDKNINCLKNNIDAHSELIDEETALLLLPLAPGHRLKYFKNTTWMELSKLNVGDECIYIIGTSESICNVVSKNKDENGITFTVNLENGPTISAGIDRLKISNKTNSLGKSSKKEGSLKEKLENLTTKPIISMFENLSKPFDTTRRSDTISYRRTTRLDYFMDETSPKCTCVKSIFEKSDDLPLNLEEKEKFLNNLFTVLPDVFEDYDGRCNLHWATYYLLVKSVEKFITNETFLNKKDNRGNTPFHLAISTPKASSKETEIKRNHETVLKIILLNGSNINIKNFQNDTPLTIAFKNGDFRLLEIIFENILVPIILSNHLLAENTSILECLIKMKKFTLASSCCNKASNNLSENIILLQATFYAVVQNYNNLALEIIEKCQDKNSLLPDGETLVTKLLKEKTVSSNTICLLLNYTPFNFDLNNKYNENPLLLACRRLFLEPIKLIINKTPTYLKQMNDCLNETITTYTNVYINNTYKRKNSSQLSVNQMKPVVFEIAELLIKNGATIDNSSDAIHSTIETCVDQDFAKAVKHLCRTNTISTKTLETELKITSETSKNECCVCMDRTIDCSLSCGHTYCSECTIELSYCPSCRQPITDRRKLFF